LTQTATPFVVVGVAADAIYASLKENAVPVLYLAHAQARKSFIGKMLAPQMTLLVRTTGKPQWAVDTVRQVVSGLDPRRRMGKLACEFSDESAYAAAMDPTGSTWAVSSPNEVALCDFAKERRPEELQWVISSLTGAAR